SSPSLSQYSKASHFIGSIPSGCTGIVVHVDDSLNRVLVELSQSKYIESSFSFSPSSLATSSSHILSDDQQEYPQQLWMHIRDIRLHNEHVVKHVMLDHHRKHSDGSISCDDKTISAVSICTQICPEIRLKSFHICSFGWDILKIGETVYILGLSKNRSTYADSDMTRLLNKKGIPQQPVTLKYISIHLSIRKECHFESKKERKKLS
ncbi:hypothetical protein ADUPG1_011840, partial [Aduncisulcus paluster]